MYTWLLWAAFQLIAAKLGKARESELALFSAHVCRDRTLQASIALGFPSFNPFVQGLLYGICSKKGVL